MFYVWCRITDVVARTQIPGESTRWIPLPRIAERHARTNHLTGLITGRFSNAPLKADSAQRERHQVVRNALGILTLILNKRTIVLIIRISADRAPRALLCPQFPHLLSFFSHVQHGGEDVHVPCHLATVAPVVRSFAFARIGPNVLCVGFSRKKQVSKGHKIVACLAELQFCGFAVELSSPFSIYRSRSIHLQMQRSREHPKMVGGGSEGPGPQFESKHARLVPRSKVGRPQ